MLCVTDNISVFTVNKRLSKEDDQLFIKYKLSFNVLLNDDDIELIVCKADPNRSEKEPET
jgi:hypothetical protein